MGADADIPLEESWHQSSLAGFKSGLAQNGSTSIHIKYWYECLCRKEKGPESG